MHIYLSTVIDVIMVLWTLVKSQMNVWSKKNTNNAVMYF